MAAITGTKKVSTEFAGNYKLVTVSATIGSSSDTITLTKATHGITTITSLVGAVITGGLDAAFTIIKPSYSGLVITIASVKADGTTAADEFTGTTVEVTVIGTTQS